MPGLSVTIVTLNEADHVAAAVAKLGAITAGVNPRLTAPERAAVLEVARPALVITTAGLEPSTGGADAPPTLVIQPATSPTTPFATFRADHAGATAPALADPDDPERVVAVVFTSGTTGRPKGAVFTNRELAAITASDVGDRWGGAAVGSFQGWGAPRAHGHGEGRRL